MLTVPPVVSKLNVYEPLVSVVRSGGAYSTSAAYSWKPSAAKRIVLRCGVPLSELTVAGVLAAT